MRSVRTLLASLTLAAALPACGPSYFLTMHPSSGSGTWANGAEIARQQHDSLEVRLSFVRYEASRLIFEAELRNRSGHDFTVSPTDFYLQPVATQPVASTAPAPVLPGRLTAFDPEPNIQELRQRIEVESAEATKVSAAEVLTSLSHTVENVAAIKKKETKEQISARENRQQNENASFDSQRLRAAAAAEQHRAQLGELEGQALRRTTLETGRAVRGYVYFPRADMADVIRVSAPGLAPGTTLDFTQTRTQQH
ncbi:hypothetical protein GCM10022409_17890 [Hymenobacter glaciei]|uniref:DUF4349 domain-containing protein n=1 Tax=Hymenobacter glaciei TaxID=877209 RepID=A0ABP7U0J1_9BACT